MKQDISNVEGTSINNNIKKNAPESKNDIEVWKTVANYLSLVLLIVAIAADFIGFVKYKNFIMNCSDCLPPTSAFITFQWIFGIFLALIFLFIASYWTLNEEMFRDSEENQHIWTIVVGIVTSILFIFCLISSCIKVGDEGINYLAWKNHPLPNIDDSNQTSLFYYNVVRTVNSNSSKFALPPTEFYDVVAKLYQPMNLTETQQFLQRFNCDDKLSFPTSLFPSLNPSLSISKCR